VFRWDRCGDWSCKPEKIHTVVDDNRVNVVHLQSRYRSADEGVAFRRFRPARTAPEPADDTKNGHVDSVCTWSRSPLGCRVAATNADRCRPNCDRRKPSRCMHRPRRTVQPPCADHPRRPNAVLRLSRTSPYTLPPPPDACPWLRLGVGISVLVMVTIRS